VENAIVKALKYDIASNSYILQESMNTNGAGEALMHLTMYDEYYKFIVEYNGVTVKTTIASYITSSSVTIQIVIGINVGEEYSNFRNLDYTFEFNNNTNNFVYTFNDLTGTITGACLETYSLGYDSMIEINSTCVTGTTGQIIHPVEVINDTTYVSKAYYYDNNDKYFLGELAHSFSGYVSYGYVGLLIQILFTGSFAMMLLWSPTVASLGVPLSLIIGRVIGFHNIGIEFLIPLLVVGLIISMVIGDKS